MGERIDPKTVHHEIEQVTDEKAEVSIEENVITLRGRFSSNGKVVEAGHIAGKFEHVRGVLNELDHPGRVPVVLPQKESDELAGREFDIVIVGGGVIGLSVARELSRYDLRIALIERHDDLGMDQTGRCSAMSSRYLGPTFDIHSAAASGWSSHCLAASSSSISCRIITS